MLKKDKRRRACVAGTRSFSLFIYVGTLLCRIPALNISDLIPGSPLDVKGAYNRSFPCIEANYPHAIKNQRGDGSLCVPKPQDARAGSLRNKIAGLATLRNAS